MSVEDGNDRRRPVHHLPYKTMLQELLWGMCCYTAFGEASTEHSLLKLQKRIKPLLRPRQQPLLEWRQVIHLIQ